jgi:hypothetical protein
MKENKRNVKMKAGIKEEAKVSKTLVHSYITKKEALWIQIHE